jgi:lipopolysaccharide export system protein LptC
MIGLFVAAVSAVLIWPHILPGGNRLRITASLPEVSLGTDREAMIGANFASYDKKGRPFSVDAEVIRNADTDRRTAELEAPVAEMTLTDGRRVKLAATSGRFDRTARSVALADGVRLQLDGDYVVNTSAATVQLDTATASGSQPVEAVGPFGTLHAEGFRVSEEGDRIEFLGRSRLIIKDAAVSVPK